MCGILGVCETARPTRPKRDWLPLSQLTVRAGLLSHRGPDMKGCYRHPASGNTVLHERLAINDMECVQPLQGALPSHQVVHNGEIYNHRALLAQHLPQARPRTRCDSEVLVLLYQRFQGAQFCNLLDGTFAFVLLFDEQFLAARDPLGVKPLYFGRDPQGRFLCASELKALLDLCSDTQLDVFPPGHFYTPTEGFQRFYEPLWRQPELQFHQPDLEALREALRAATVKRLMSDAPLGLLLSGGLDSSLVCALAVRQLRLEGRPLRTYAVGLAESPDLRAARRVADFLGTEHTEVHFTVQQGLSALVHVVRHLESYDVTTVRSAVPMFFLSRRIRQDGLKVVLSGEGADEVFGGYLYFHLAPDEAHFHQETVRRVGLLHTSDLLRADKSCMANAVEVRVPFLDKAFLELALSLSPAARRPGPGRIEKHVLRQAFDCQETPFLPADVLWRQKEQFSDGVGYSWIESLSSYCEQLVTDEELAQAPELFPLNTPSTKEAFLVRRTFDFFFPGAEAARTVTPWVPRWQASLDPSGRASTVHQQGHHAGQNGYSAH